MDWKKLSIWAALIVAALAVTFALFFSSFDSLKTAAVIGDLPATSAGPAPAPPPPPPPAPVDEVKILPPKAYAPRPMTPPSAAVRPRPVPPGGISSLDTWPDPNRNRAFEQLKSASMAFNVDNKFNVEETGKAKVIIDFSKKVEELKKDLERSGKAGSITGGATVQVSKVVIANIVAPGLTVTPITPNEQVVLESEPTTWMWDLKADKPGTYSVRITLTASIIIDGRATNKFLRVHEETVTIEITPRQRVMEVVTKNWQWAFSSLLVPLGVWLWKRRKRRSTR